MKKNTNQTMIFVIAIVILLIFGSYSVVTFLKSREYIPYEREEKPQYATGLVEIYFEDNNPMKAEEKITIAQGTSIPVTIKESKNSGQYIVVGVPPGREDEYIIEINTKYKNDIKKIQRLVLRPL